ncbi:MAG: SRPBCC domain-containing protein [Alphaproteobacteria bacterium]|nr:SRPBCC domain-containing protein [Alphaproteobacteria bacterium]
MTLDIRLEHRISHPIESVWSAISTSKGLAAWLMENDFAPHIGHRFRLIGEAVPGWRGWAECEILELDPPHRMVWAWWANDDKHETKVTFELVQEPGATRLILTHRGEESPVIAELLAGGWPGRLASIQDMLDKTE